MSQGNQNSNLVTAAKPRSAAGAIFGAPRTVKVPTDPFSPLPDEFRSLGYLSEDGITNGVESDTETITAFGGDSVLTIKTSHQETFVFRPIEKNAAVLAETWGQDNVEEVSDDTGSYLKVAHTSKDAQDRVYVIELSLNGDRVERLVIPNGKVTEIGENAMVHNDAQGHELTISASTDENGVTAYEYIAAVSDISDAMTIETKPITTGTLYGVDVSTLGDIEVSGTTVTGTAKKVTVPDFDGPSSNTQGYFCALGFDPAPKKFYTANHPAGINGDTNLVILLGAEDPTTFKYLEIEGDDESRRRYTFSVTKDE